MLRRNYEEALWKARQFFLEQKLFIPTKIAECAESTLRAAITEKNLYDMFHDHYDPGVRAHYSKELPKLVSDYDSGMESLEKLMRGHIDGERLNLETAQR